MVLCVSGILWSEGGVTDDGLKIEPYPELELTDGWYRLRAQVDLPMARAVGRNVIRVGRKLGFAGAKVGFLYLFDSIIEKSLTRGEFCFFSCIRIRKILARSSTHIIPRSSSYLGIHPTLCHGTPGSGSQLVLAYPPSIISARMAGSFRLWISLLPRLDGNSTKTRVVY